MRKLMMGLKVGLLVVGLLAMVAAPAMAQFADPLTLATSGVLLPYFGVGNNVTLLELIAPVTGQPNLHMIFYNAFCSRVVSRPWDMTTNDVDILLLASSGGVPPALVTNNDGLVAIASEAQNGIDLVPLNQFGNTAPLFARNLWINVNANRFRILEPIVLDIFEASGAVTWSPIRTGAAFFAPVDSPVGLQTTLYLICPRDTIQGATSPLAAFPTTLFPVPLAPSTSGIFKSSYGVGSIRARVYDDEENLQANLQLDCNCLQNRPLGPLDITYSLFDTMTEMETDGTFAGFTGYTGITFGATPVDLFGRIHAANRLSLIGNYPLGPGGCGANCR